MSSGAEARTIMVQGTASGSGKSWLVTGLCRALHRRGRRVAPFKAVNMSNNAAVTPAAGEVGRAQAVQAEAAGVDVEERMNPVLVKPLSDRRSDVVLLGGSRPDLARIPWMDRRSHVWPTITRALDELSDEYEWIVIEGAGSPAEPNLMRADAANMAVARYAEAPVLLVTDIDRGGAFASLGGTWELLEPRDRALLREFVLNRFRGDPALLGEAAGILRSRTGVDLLGVVPWVDARLPEEDATTIERTRGRGRVGVLRLPRIANLDDVLPLDGDAGPGVRWIDHAEELAGVRAVVLPGTRNVVADLGWLRAPGLDAAVRLCAERGTPVLGLCGGFQMLGWIVEDPLGIEAGSATPGLALLPVCTSLDEAKVVRRSCTRWADWGGPRDLEGYEIHRGRTWMEVEPGGALAASPLGEAHAFAWDADDPERVLGVRRANVWGTYVHGCLRDDRFRGAWLGSGGHLGVSSEDATAWSASNETDASILEPGPIDIVTDAVEAAIDLDELFRLVEPS